MKKENEKTFRFILTVIFGTPALFLSLRIVRYWDLHPDVLWNAVIGGTALFVIITAVNALTKSIVK